jgi:hypothetical protein
MTRTAKWGLVLALLALAGVARAQTASFIQGTSGAKVGNWEVQAGGVVLRQGSAGSAFGTVRKGAPTHTFSYFLVLKHRYGSCSKVDASEKADTTEKKATTKQLLTIDGNKLTIGYQIDFDLAAKRAVRESITINGKAVNVAKGRVLLVDMTANPPKWQQKNLELPAVGPTAVTEEKAAEALTRKVFEALGKKDKDVRAFIAGAK